MDQHLLQIERWTKNTEKQTDGPTIPTYGPTTPKNRQININMDKYIDIQTDGPTTP